MACPTTLPSSDVWSSRPSPEDHCVSGRQALREAHQVRHILGAFNDVHPQRHERETQAAGGTSTWVLPQPWHVQLTLHRVGPGGKKVRKTNDLVVGRSLLRPKDIRRIGKCGDHVGEHDEVAIRPGLRPSQLGSTSLERPTFPGRRRRSRCHLDRRSLPGRANRLQARRGSSVARRRMWSAQWDGVPWVAPDVNHRPSRSPRRPAPSSRSTMQQRASLEDLPPSLCNGANLARSR